ncbi:hypothetical protein AB0M10_03805 [Streptomyces sp. NPDC051840]|uniref:hypothetical protein n=1 Tax=Streptomyces sp. NPDC051840 TaxID=3154752 RepID=UPI003435D381
MRRKVMYMKNFASMGATVRLALCGALVVTVVSGCSDTGSEEAEGLAPSQICDGALGASGASALERISGADRFTELDGSQANGDPNAFSLPLAAKRLHDDLGDRNQCQPYKVDSDFPVLTIDFEARTSHADPKKVPTDDLSVYPLGRFAVTHQGGGATLVFSCPTKGDEEKTTPYIRAKITVTKSQVAPDSTDKDQMTVLTAASRAMADELGCAAQAKLPSEVPDALAR